MINKESQTFNGSPRPTVAVLNPYLPRYRRDFFDGVKESATAQGVNFILITGRPSKRMSSRGDTVTASYHKVVPQLSLNFFMLRFRLLFASRLLRESSAVVYELSITNLNSWLAVLRKKRHKVILWGHGPGYLSKDSGFKSFLLRQMANRADQILTYTEGGKRSLITLGVNGDKIQSVDNTFDWSNLKLQVDSLTNEEARNFRLDIGFEENDIIFSFIGALDKEKRIDFLAKVMNVAWNSNRSIKFIFAGNGPELYKLKPAIERGQAIYLQRADDVLKAKIGRISRAILCPGNVGLIAVDALVLGRPILSTFARSSPEKEYLTENDSLFTLSNIPENFVQDLERFSRTPLSQMERPNPPTLVQFVTKFSESILLKAQINRKPKFLYITNLPAPYRLSLFHELSKSYELTVGFTGWRSEERQWKGIPSQESKYKVAQVARLYGIGKTTVPIRKLNLRRLVREADLVLVGGWDSPAYISALRVGRKSKTKTLLWFESTLKSARYTRGPISRLREYAFSLPDAIVVPGAAAKLAAIHYSGGKKPVWEVGNPINSDYAKYEKKNPLSFSSEKSKFLFVGRLIQLKRIDLLIDAFDLVARDQDTLTIVGGGPFEQSLRKQAAEKKSVSRIAFTGPVPDETVFNYYLQNDVLVLPSNREVWGMVVAEAMTLGLKAVASDSVGSASTFQEFESFLEFETDSLESLAEALKSSRGPYPVMSAEKQTKLNNFNSATAFVEKLVSYVEGQFQNYSAKSSSESRLK